MGRYASRLHRKLASKADSLPTEEPQRRPGELLPGGIKDIPMLIKDGLDPIHAVYAFIHNMATRFAEVVAPMPEMKTWARTVEKAEDEYLPSGPPMSPLTGSYFWMWALYDLRIGKSTDTMAYCQIAANDVILANVHQLDVLKKRCACAQCSMEKWQFLSKINEIPLAAFGDEPDRTCCQRGVFVGLRCVCRRP